MSDYSEKRAEAYERNRMNRASVWDKRERLRRESDARIVNVSREIAKAITKVSERCSSTELVHALPMAIIDALTACETPSEVNKCIHFVAGKLNYKVRKDKKNYDRREREQNTTTKR